MKNVSLLKIFIGITFIFASQASLAGQDGRGGGVLHIGNRSISFASAGISMKLVPLREVPGKARLNEVITQMPLPRYFKNFLFESYENMGSRQYYKVTSKGKGKALASLLKEYTALQQLKFSQEVVRIAAITSDTVTYLLDPFFALESEDERAAILWHEMGWINKVFEKYPAAVDSEIRFQNYSQGKSVFEFDRDFFLHLSDLFDDKIIAIQAAAQADEKSGILREFMDPQGRIFIGRLLNLTPDVWRWREWDTRVGKFLVIHSDILKSFVVDAYRRNPNSALLQVLYAYRLYGELNFFRGPKEYCDPVTDSLNGVGAIPFLDSEKIIGNKNQLSLEIVPTGLYTDHNTPMRTTRTWLAACRGVIQYIFKPGSVVNHLP